MAAVALVAACQGPVGTTFPSSESPVVAVPNADGASVVAVRLASIRGPFNIGEIKRGTYADLWRGSTNDALGASAADAAATAQLVVWRVDLQGPTGSEEVYVDEATGALVDSIVEGQ